jgi:hypothetical protein
LTLLGITKNDAVIFERKKISIEQTNEEKVNNDFSLNFMTFKPMDRNHQVFVTHKTDLEFD